MLLSMLFFSPPLIFAIAHNVNAIIVRGERFEAGHVLNILAVATQGASMIFNLGWFRLLFSPLILLHGILFAIINRPVPTMSDRASKIMRIVSAFAFAGCYAAMPDFLDAPNSVVAFFGLLRQGRRGLEAISEVGMMLMLLNIGLLVLVAALRSSRKNMDPAKASEAGPRGGKIAGE